MNKKIVVIFIIFILLIFAINVKNTYLMKFFLENVWWNENKTLPLHHQIKKTSEICLR